MKILGIDPGSRITGFGLIEAHKLKFTYISSGCIYCDGELVKRITTIFVEIKQIIEKYQPNIVVIERTFMRPDRPNPDAAIKLGQARGAIIAAAGYSNIKMVEYSPNQIKKMVVGKGHATKGQVAFMVTKLLKLKKNPAEDAADALAGAMCYAYNAL